MGKLSPRASCILSDKCASCKYFGSDMECNADSPHVSIERNWERFVDYVGKCDKYAPIEGNPQVWEVVILNDRGTREVGLVLARDLGHLSYTIIKYDDIVEVPWNMLQRTNVRIQPHIRP